MRAEPRQGPVRIAGREDTTIEQDLFLASLTPAYKIGTAVAGLINTLTVILILSAPAFLWALCNWAFTL